MGLNPITGVFVRERRGKFGHRDTHKGEGHVKTEVEIGVMQPQGKGCQEPTGAGRGKETFSPRAFRGDVALLTP